MCSTPVSPLTRSLSKLLCTSLALLKLVAYLSQENTEVLLRSHFCVIVFSFSQSWMHCLVLSTVSVPKSYFHFHLIFHIRLKVASAKCLLHLKCLSQNTSALSDTRACKSGFQCYSLIFSFKLRIFSLESTPQLSNT